jgi:3-demethoxyubiquinol 3-hydroxylase
MNELARNLDAVSCASPSAEHATAAQLIKLNHLGEFIAVNIYSAQLRVCRLTAPPLLPMLEDFLSHERRHLSLFESVLTERGIARCRGFAALGAAGFLLGFLSALFGRSGVMACTAAVETVVLEHLDRQLVTLRRVGDARAIATIESILCEEIDHRDAGAAEGGGPVYRMLYALIARATAAVIALGMQL